MRIISGKFRKKSIYPPKNFKARPTTDIAKEGLFNIIENNFDIEEIKVLDLFAGTGSISYEFASRECPDISCVEMNYQHYGFIKKQISELAIDDQLRAIKSNAFVFIKRISEKYDLIFADPPYDIDKSELIPEMVFENDLLNKEGWLIMEHSENINFSNKKYFFMHKKYGKVNFSFFKY